MWIIGVELLMDLLTEKTDLRQLPEGSQLICCEA